ncbi:unnamed protein product [Cuscuta europaea]|uniref:GAG-pre-integrase domain-containing protein n=1 Tax=Cuscuta europaea TaxID=41803 RepID=A0A9P0YIT7_CUSEU|nr:unnamed protein product [Cuscuta europaea]
MNESTMTHTTANPLNDEPKGSGDSSRTPVFTDVQWRSFLQLMNQCKVVSPHGKLSGKFPWLLDSGASFHMTGQESLLMNIRNISPMSVFLPNGDVTYATSKGEDLLSRTPIGAGEKRGGVYYFHSLDPVCACSITKEDQSDLWHSRLGHPSVKVLRSVISFSNNIPALLN